MMIFKKVIISLNLFLLTFSLSGCIGIAWLSDEESVEYMNGSYFMTTHYSLEKTFDASIQAVKNFKEYTLDYKEIKTNYAELELTLVDKTSADIYLYKIDKNSTKIKVRVGMATNYEKAIMLINNIESKLK